MAATAMRGGGGYWVRRWQRRGFALGAIGLAVCLAGCGGPNEADVASIVGGETSGEPSPTSPTSPPSALGGPTSASRISFQAGSSVEVEMFDEVGRCIINVDDEIIALVGDFRGQAVPAGTPIAFFIASGRGIIEGQALTDETGVAEATFRSLCPSNASEWIEMLAAVRGAEPFTDLNSNGRRDANEPFTDLEREAFLDANANGAFEPELNEYMIWDPNRNGRFDAGGNGIYDTDTIIAARAVIIPIRKSASPGPGTPGTETPTPATPGASETPATPTPTRTPSVVPAFLQVALFVNLVSDNHDGTLSSVISAQVSDANGVALDEIPVEFRVLPPVTAGISVTSPSFSGRNLGCSLEFTVPGQPGNALSCLKYDSTLQGQTISVEARTQGASGPLVSSQTILLPDIRPITLTPVPTGTLTVSPTPKRIPKFLQLALFTNLTSTNSDGTYSTALTALVSDKDGVALDDIFVNFRLLAPVQAGVIVTSPGVTGAELPCVLQFPPPIPPPPPQPGDALSCLKYDSALQGQTVTIEASVQTTEGLLVDTVAVRLPVVGTSSPEAARFLQLGSFIGQASNNNDGTFSTVLTALVSDGSGVALNGLNVEFSILPPVISGVVITSPGITGSFLPCTLGFLVPAQPGDALTCVKYDAALGGQAISVEARLVREAGDLVDSQTIVLPDLRVPTLSPTATVTPSPQVDVPTASPTATATAPADSVEFMGADPVYIGVRQSGLPEQSTLTFRVTDPSRNPIAGVDVFFQLTGIGGERLSVTRTLTNSAGVAATVLTSGTRAAPVRVTAGVDVDGDGFADVFAQSTQIAVLGAPPAQNRYSAAAERLNVAGRRYYGIRDTISAYVNDRFGNAVPPGTAVTFVSNGASIVNPTTTDAYGVATATLVTEGGIPTSGIVTVLAFTRGEEAFLDTNGDGVFQTGIDSIIDDDQPEPFISFRPLPSDLAFGGLDDSLCSILAPSAMCRDSFQALTPYDLFVDTDANGAWNSQGTSGIWDSNVLIATIIPVTFSGTLVAPEVIDVSPEPEPGDSEDFHLAKGESAGITFTVHDDLRNPLVAGSTIEVTTTRGEVIGGSITILDGESFNQLRHGLNVFTVYLTNKVTNPGTIGEGTPTPTPVPSGPAEVLVTIESENGNGTFFLARGFME